MNTGNKSRQLQVLLYVFAIIGITSTIYHGVIPFFTAKGATTVSAQTNPFLERRINQIETRFITIESRINRLESESRLTTVTPRITNNNDVEISLLRSQVETLGIRVGELECGLLKLDERTLTGSARQTRKQAGSGTTEPCRLDTNTPLKLSARP